MIYPVTLPLGEGRCGADRLLLRRGRWFRGQEEGFKGANRVKYISL